jgi:hypothetical protein
MIAEQKDSAVCFTSGDAFFYPVSDLLAILLETDDRYLSECGDFVVTIKKIYTTDDSAYCRTLGVE